MKVFSSLSDRKNKKKNAVPTVEDHYTSLGRKAAVVRYACLLLVMLFALYSFISHRDEITIANFRYMLKFISLGENSEKPVGSVINFDGSENCTAAIYKGDLAVLSSSGLSVIGWDGGTILKDSFSYDHPKMLQNGVNIICCDLGGKELKIFNTYSRLYDQSFDYPIYCLAVSASGAYAVASSAQGYRSAVYTYDKDFRPIYTCYFGNKYIDFVDISPAGDEIIVAGLYSENGDISALVARYSTSSDTPACEKSFIGEIPLGIYYTDSGYALLTGDAFRVFSREDELVGTVSFSGKKPVSAKVYGDRILVTYSAEGLSGGTELAVCASDGSTEFTQSFPHSLTDTIIIGDKVYSLSPGKLTEATITDGSVVTYNVLSSFSAMIADGDGRLILVSDSEAHYFSGADITD